MQFYVYTRSQVGCNFYHRFRISETPRQQQETLCGAYFFTEKSTVFCCSLFFAAIFASAEENYDVLFGENRTEYHNFNMQELLENAQDLESELVFDNDEEEASS
jgi:hypothetical protein